MTRVQFLIVTILSGIVALFIVLQIAVGWNLSSKEKQLQSESAALQEGESDFQRLQQIATRIAQLSSNDDQMKDLLTRNNIQIGATNAAPSSPAPSQPAPATTH